MSYDLPVDGDAEVLVSAPLAPTWWSKAGEGLAAGAEEGEVLR